MEMNQLFCRFTLKYLYFSLNDALNKKNTEHFSVTFKEHVQEYSFGKLIGKIYTNSHPIY